MDQKGLNLSQPVVKDYESIGGKKNCSKGERNLALSAQPRQASPREVMVSGHESLSSANNSRDSPEKGSDT